MNKRLLSMLIFIMCCFKSYAMECTNSSKFLITTYINNNTFDNQNEIPDLVSVENNIIYCNINQALSMIPESEMSLDRLRSNGLVKSILIDAKICAENFKALAHTFTQYRPAFAGTLVYSNMAKNIINSPTYLIINEAIIKFLRKIKDNKSHPHGFVTAFFMTLSFIAPVDIQLKINLAYKLGESPHLAKTINDLIKMSLKKRLGFDPFNDVDEETFNRMLFERFTDIDLITCAIGEVYMLFLQYFVQKFL